MDFPAAVRKVAKKYPDLAMQVLVERFPVKFNSKDTTAIFAYQFMTTKGKNVATYILALGFTLYHDKGGRDYDKSLATETMGIADYLALDKAV